jgi:small GTP-binding protein
MQDNRFKVLLVGDSGVGKSSIILRFTEHYFEDNFVNTIGVDFRCHSLEFNNKIYKLQIWDTAGQDKFQSITTSYYRGSNGIILVYDVCNPSSLDRLKFWYNEVKKKVTEDIPMIIVGNKIDLSSNRKVSYEEGEAFAKELNMQYLECSTKLDEGINKIFFTLLEKIVDTNVESNKFETHDSIYFKNFDKLNFKSVSGNKPFYKRCC